jgi:hypothetical protein
MSKKFEEETARIRRESAVSIRQIVEDSIKTVVENLKFTVDVLRTFQNIPLEEKIIRNDLYELNMFDSIFPVESKPAGVGVSQDDVTSYMLEMRDLTITSLPIKLVWDSSPTHDTQIQEIFSHMDSFSNLLVVKIPEGFTSILQILDLDGSGNFSFKYGAKFGYKKIQSFIQLAEDDSYLLAGNNIRTNFIGYLGLTKTNTMQLKSTIMCMITSVYVLQSPEKFINKIGYNMTPSLPVNDFDKIDDHIKDCFFFCRKIQ